MDVKLAYYLMSFRGSGMVVNILFDHSIIALHVCLNYVMSNLDMLDLSYAECVVCLLDRKDNW